MFSKFIKILSFPLIVIFCFYFFIYPVFIEAIDNRQKLTEEESKLEAIENGIKSMEESLSNSIDYLNSEDGKKDHSFINLAIPSNPNVHDFILSLYNTKDKSSIDFLTIEGTSLNNDPEYEDIYKVDLSFSVSGGYDQVNTFIRNLEKMDRIFIIKGIEFTKDRSTQVVSSGVSTEQYENIRASINGYFLYNITRDLVRGISLVETSKFITVIWDIIQDESVTGYEVQYCIGELCEFVNSVKTLGNKIGAYQIPIENHDQTVEDNLLVERSERIYRVRIRTQKGVLFGPWSSVANISIR